MKRELMKKINAQCYELFDYALSEFYFIADQKGIRLNSCKAWVYETEHFFILQSYNTIVACIEKKSDVLVDVLRTEFGYTATSAQHIAKFSRKYGSGKFGCTLKFTAYPVD